MNRILLTLLLLLLPFAAAADSIYLVGTTETLEVTTSSTASLAYKVSYEDDYAGRQLTKSVKGAISSATTTTIVTAPPATTQRRVNWLHLQNESTTTANAVTLILDVGGTDYKITPAITLAAKEALSIDTEGRLVLYDSSGLEKVNTSGGGGGGGLTAVSDDTSPTLGGDLDVAGYDLTGLDQVGVRNLYCDSEATCEASLTRLGSGIGAANNLTGGTVTWLGGEHNLCQIDLGGASAAAGMTGVVFQGVGGGEDVSGTKTGYHNGGTVLVGTCASPMIRLRMCNECTIRNFSIAGEDTGTVGIQLLGGTGAPVKNFAIQNVGMFEINGFGITTSGTNQIDTGLIQNVSVRDSVGCYQQVDSQNVGIIWDRADCSTQTGTTQPAFDIQNGEFNFQNSYLGLIHDNAVGFQFGDTTNRISVTGSQIEFPDITGALIVDDDDGAGDTQVSVRIFRDNKFIYNSAGNTVFDVRRRGAYTIHGNTFYNINGGADYSTTSTFDRDAGYATNHLIMAISNNIQAGGDSGQSTIPEIWEPTIGTGVWVESEVIASTDLTGLACNPWQVGRDTDATSGQQLYACESGTWQLQGDGSSSAGDAVNINGTDIVDASGVRFNPGVGVTITPNTGVSPDTATLELLYSATLAGDPALNAKECVFVTTGSSGGGFLCEGSTGSNANEQLHLFAAADGADTTDFIATASAAVTDAIGAATTNTLTNKTLNVESSGNDITTLDVTWLPAAGCNNVTPATFYDLPTTNAAAPACVTASIQKGVLDFDPSTDESGQVTLLLPTGTTGTMDAKFKWYANLADNTKNVVWGIQTLCTADGETDDTSFSNTSTVTDAAKGTANQTNDASITGVTITDCAAGELMHVRIYRDADNASDTVTTDARLIGVELTTRRTQ